MEVPDLVALFKRLAIVGLCYSDDDVNAALILSYTLQQFWQRRYEGLVADNQERPALICYMGDGWGASVNEALAVKFPGSHVRVSRNGKYRHEFLLQRAVYRIDTGGGNQAVGHFLSSPLD